MTTKKDVLEWLRRNPGALEGEFQVRRQVPTTKKTFEVEVDLLERFRAEIEKRGLKVKDAVGQALRGWLGEK